MKRRSSNAWMHAHIQAIYSSEVLLSNKVIPEHILMKRVASKRQEANAILSDHLMSHQVLHACWHNIRWAVIPREQVRRWFCTEQGQWRRA